MTNIWAMLIRDEDIDRAEDLVSAAIGADVDPTVFTAELERACNRFLNDDAEVTAENLLSFLAALIGIARGSLAQFAALVADSKGEDENDPAATRPYEVHLLAQAAASLRATVADEPPE